MKSFKLFFKEENIAGDGGVFGSAPSMGFGGAVGNTDFYAPGDSRIPWLIGAYSRKGKVGRRKRKRKKRSK